jgi:transposase
MLGIDTSKNKLQCALRDPADRRLLWEIEVQNNQAGVEKLLKKTPPEIPWVLEPTGRYSLGVAQQAQAAGRKTLLAPPRKAKAFLASLQDRAKTDKLDSKGLALFAFSQSLAAYPLKDKALDMIDQLLSARKGLSMACSKLQLQSQELPQARSILDQAIADLKAKIQALDKQVAALSAAEPRMAMAKNLREVPGIGPVTSVAVVSRLAQKAFSHPDQFVAYLGLDIGVNESGQQKGKRGLTHQGDAELRRLLFCCAQSSLRVKDSPFKAQYERERAKGLSTTAALCAVARKIAKLCWSLHKNNATYDPSRVYTAPDRRKPKLAEQTPKNDEEIRIIP